MYKIILKAAEIPEKSIVTKINGKKEYAIRKEITIYRKSGDKQKITANGGSCFLINTDGDINAVDSTTELIWLAEESELLSFIDQDCFTCS